MLGGGFFLFDGFNTSCENIYASFLKVGDEYMSEIRFPDDGKRELTSLVVYFRQAGVTGYRVQDSCLLCYRGLDIH